MAAETGIEWCDSTFNPWIGCTRVGPGCDNCYAAVSTPSRAMGIKWGAGEPRKRTSASNWAQPVKWERNAPAFQAEHGRRQRVFCASLADWLDKVPLEWLVDLLDLWRVTPNLDKLALTKRIGNWRGRLQEAATYRLAQVLADSGEPARDPLWQWLEAWLAGNPPAHVWIGATVVNQEEADRDIPKLLAVPARVHFLSMEPLLGPVDLRRWIGTEDCAPMQYLEERWANGADIDWVIGGFESGHHARPGNPAWARSLRDQCAAAGTAFLWKQNGEWASVSEVGGGKTHHYFPDGATVRLVGKKAAGRLLDGVEHNGFPEER